MNAASKRYDSGLNFGTLSFFDISLLMLRQEPYCTTMQRPLFSPKIQPSDNWITSCQRPWKEVLVITG